MTNTEVFYLCEKKWGIPAQCIVAIEELSEVQKEICKYLRGGRYLRDDGKRSLAEEIADASLMLDQMMYMLGIIPEVRSWKAKKINRLKGMLSK